MTDVKFTRFSGEIEFRFTDPVAAEYLLETMFLLKVLQTQASNDECWFFSEKLSHYQEYIQGFLNGARKMGFVRKFKIGNRANWMTVKTEDIKSERPIYIQEPKAQILDHTQLKNHAPTKQKANWQKLITLNKQKTKKNCLRTYNYQSKTFYSIDKAFGALIKKEIERKNKGNKRKAQEIENKQKENKKNKQE